MLIINPDDGINRSIPNMQAAFASAYYKCPVIDLNTKPLPPHRYLDKEESSIVISSRTMNLSTAKEIGKAYLSKYPKAEVKSLAGFIDVQCCYPFLTPFEALGDEIKFSDELPFPDYNLFDSVEVFKKNWSSGAWNFPLMTSNGCPFSCVYCAARNRPYLTRSIDKCIEEIKSAMNKWQFSSFEILDDCFNAKKERLLEFCSKVEPLKLKWSCTNGLRADLFDEEAAAALKRSGCSFISFGIESTHNEILKTIKKGETFEEIDAAAAVAKKYFDTVNGYFIIGLPGSSYEKDLESLQWSVKRGINAHFSFFVPAKDKNLLTDSLFYGESAQPLSNAYSKDLQWKIYNMTKNMRAEAAKPGILKRGLNKIKRMISER